MLHSPGGVPMALQAKVQRHRVAVLRLAGRRSLVWLDWRGSGESESCLPTSSGDLLQDVAAVTAALNEVSDVVAPNASCLDACMFAAANPGAWRSLILTNPMVTLAGSPQGMIVRPGWEADYAGLVRTLVRHFFPWLFGEEFEAIASEWTETVPRDAQQAYRTIHAGLDVTDALKALDLPVLVYKSMPGSMAASVASLIPNCILIEREFGPLGGRVRHDWDELIGSRLGEPSGPPGEPTTLSNREAEVLARLVEGKSNGTIAAELTLSTRTVEQHVRNIYTKLDVHNRVEATRWALEHRVG
jgi:DNA-binding CsgD family transcriptional regulator/pimeloyl-ACP methyl ester carboxylesterase